MDSKRQSQDCQPGRRARREQSPGEEIANTVTHGLGLMLSCACLTLGVVFAALRGDAWIVVSVSVYGATLCLLYLASTLYHGTRERSGISSCWPAACCISWASCGTSCCLRRMAAPTSTR
jgi:channel protein (hemolysin III family)